MLVFSLILNISTDTFYFIISEVFICELAVLVRGLDLRLLIAWTFPVFIALHFKNAVRFVYLVCFSFGKLIFIVDHVLTFILVI
jgi:hypothetical protein